MSKDNGDLILEIMDGIEARKYWLQIQQKEKDEGGDYDHAIDDTNWIYKYINGICD